MTRVVRWVSLIAIAAGCGGHVTQYERDGDRMRAAGNLEGAADAYEHAMAYRPIMDFDYERARDKRLAVVGTKWKPQIAMATSAGTGDAIVDLGKLLETRHGARMAATGADVRAPLEAAITEAAKPDRLVAASNVPDDPIGPLLTLLQTALDKSATQPTVDAIITAIRDKLRASWSPSAGNGLGALESILAARTRVRVLNLPADIEAGVAAQLNGFTGATTQVTAANAASVFERAYVAGKSALDFGAPPVAVAVARQAQSDAIGHLLAHADAQAATHYYVEAYFGLMALSVRSLEPIAILTQKIDALARAGAEWHTATAQQLPAGHRRYLHLAIAAALVPAGRPAANEAATAIDRPITLALEVPAPGGSCSEVGRSIRGSQGTRRTPVSLSLSCTSEDKHSTQTRQSEPFEVLVTGTRMESYTETIRDPGTHFESCSETTEFGNTLVGKCEVPNGGTIQVQRQREVPYTEIVKQTQEFQVDVREPTVTATGTASMTWDDGTVLSTTIESRQSSRSEAFDYETPGAKLADPRRHVSQAHSGVSVASVAASTGSDVSFQIVKLNAEVTAHRGQRARADGVAAVARNDDAAAGEAFIRSVTIEGEAKSEAETWFARALHLSASDAKTILFERKLLVPGPPAVAPLVAYIGGAELQAKPDGMPNDLLMGVDHMTTESQHSGVKHGADAGYFFAGPSPYNIKTATGSLTTVTVGFQFSMSPVSMVTRYGPAIRDDLGFRLSWGMRFGSHDYANGDEEGQLAYAVEGFYRLMAGLRLHYVGLYGGLGVGWMRVSAGDTVAKGTHIEPAAHLSIRAFETRNLLVDVSGFAYRIGDRARRDRVSLMIPLGAKRLALAMGFAYESTDIETKSLAEDGTTTMNLGRQPVRWYGLQIGGSL